MPRAPFEAGSTAVNKIDTVGLNAVCGFTREAAATVTAAAKEIWKSQTTGASVTIMKATKENNIIACIGQSFGSDILTRW